MDLDKLVMTSIYHYSMTQHSFTALEVLCAPPTHPFLPPKPWQPLILLPSPYFYLFLILIWLESYNRQPFQVGFFDLVICISVSSIFFNGSIAHIFLTLIIFHCPMKCCGFVHPPTEGHPPRLGNHK